MQSLTVGHESLLSGTRPILCVVHVLPSHRSNHKPSDTPPPLVPAPIAMHTFVVGHDIESNAVKPPNEGAFG